MIISHCRTNSNEHLWVLASNVHFQKTPQTACDYALASSIHDFLGQVSQVDMAIC